MVVLRDASHSNVENKQRILVSGERARCRQTGMRLVSGQWAEGSMTHPIAIRHLLADAKIPFFPFHQVIFSYIFGLTSVYVKMDFYLICIFPSLLIRVRVPFSQRTGNREAWQQWRDQVCIWKTTRADCHVCEWIHQITIAEWRAQY